MSSTIFIKEIISSQKSAIEILNPAKLKTALIDAGIKIKFDIKKLNGIVTGFFCLAPSVLRKSHTVDQVQKLIEENNLPLTVETGSDFNNQFKVQIIDLPVYYEYGGAVTKIISPELYVDVQYCFSDYSISLLRDKGMVRLIAKNGRKITEDQFNEILKKVIDNLIPLMEITNNAA